MDWDHAIKRNSEVLAGIVETLFVMLGLVGEATVSRISWPAYRAVLRVLRPAEIRPAAADCRCGTGSCGEAHGFPSQKGGGSKTKERAEPRVSPPSSFSTRSHASCCRAGEGSPRAVPRIHFFNTDGEFITIGPPIRPAKAPARAKSADGMVNAARVIRRLEALEAALADLPRQAKRLVRWRMREEKVRKSQFQNAAPAGPSAGLPQAGGSPRR